MWLEAHYICVFYWKCLLLIPLQFIPRIYNKNWLYRVLSKRQQYGEGHLYARFGPCDEYGVEVERFADV